MATSPQFVATPNDKVTQFTNATGTTTQTIYTPGSNGSLINAIFTSGNDTVARSITLYLYDTVGAVYYGIDTVLLPAATSGTPIAQYSFITSGRWLWLNGAGGFVLPATYRIAASMVATITSSTYINTIVLGGDF